MQNTEEEGGGRRRLGGGGEAHCLWTGEMVVSGGSELSEVVGKNTAQKREQKSPSSEALDDPSHPTRGWMTRGLPRYHGDEVYCFSRWAGSQPTQYATHHCRSRSRYAKSRQSPFLCLRPCIHSAINTLGGRLSRLRQCLKHDQCLPPEQPPLLPRHH